MRLSVSKSANSTSLYAIESTYINGKHSSRVVEKLGTVAELAKKLNGQDPIEWARSYVAELNRQEEEGTRVVTIQYSSAERIEKGEQQTFNGGYLFLQRIYHDLKLDHICAQISDKYKFTFDLNTVLSRLIYSRIIYPGSKRATHELSARFLEQPAFQLQHVYRSLEVIAKEMDFIQTEVYKNCADVQKRQTGILYYDCTNFFFEIEQEDGLKQYGYSKEHRPNPIVQLGLFMDGDGMPLAFCIEKGNTNEQLTMTPLEKKILDDFGLSRFIVCTDAGLASTENRKFNDKGGRAFITTQSVKKLKKSLKEWALSPEGWHLPGSDRTYDITKLDETEELENERRTGKGNTYYKEQWINEDGLEQKLIVTFSTKYRNYQRRIREAQVDRAKKLLQTRPDKVNKKGQNDYRRFVAKTGVTKEGEVADTEVFYINEALIEQEGVYDGFYAVCTNLEDGPEAIIDVNHRRWEIEECFRIMKSEFKSRPVYLSRTDRIKAHFTTCFLALLFYRLLEKRLDNKFTGCQIINGLRNFNFRKAESEGYLPAYTRDEFTDALHDKFGFKTDTRIVTNAQMKKIFRLTSI